MKTDNLDQALRENLRDSAPAEIHTATQRHFDEFAAQLGQRAATPPPRERHPLWKLWLGLSLAGTAATAMIFFTFFFTPTLSWADVVEHFRTLRFFNATVYLTENPEQPPEKIEVWASQDHRCRVHYRGLILFGEGGKIVKALNAQTGAEISIEELKAGGSDRKYPAIYAALNFPEQLGAMPNFSLDELLTIFSGKRADLQPVPNMDASIANDMQVFDISTPQTHGWMRMWVLKKSGLLTRIHMLNPESGAQSEATFDYFTAMPDEAFDADKVQAAIRKQQGDKSKLNALLKDPGGRPLSPQDMFNQTGYHKPTDLSSGRTEDGIFWVMSDDSINIRPDGGRHSGWGRLTDNLGQKYAYFWVGETFNNDKSTSQLEYYIPLDYRAGYKKPDSYTLTCIDRVEFAGMPQPPVVIGSVDFTDLGNDWSDNTPVPKLYNQAAAVDTAQIVRNLLSQLYSNHDWKRFDHLAATIPGEPEKDAEALNREIMICKKLDITGPRDQAAALRTRLYPLVKDAMKTENNWQQFDVIEGHIADLVRDGQGDTAREIANVCVTNLTRLKMTSEIFRFVYTLHRGGMKEDDIRKFFDVDVLGMPEIMEQARITQLFQDEQSDPVTSPRFAAWRGYLVRLSDRYSTQPLPADFELIEDEPALGMEQVTAQIPLPGHPEYLVTYIPHRGDTKQLAIDEALQVGLDVSQVTAPKSAGDITKSVVCVYKKGTPWPQIWAAYLKWNHIDVVEKTARRKVLVAKYDGRKLPSPTDVVPMDGAPKGLKMIFSESGQSLSPGRLMDYFKDAINFGLAPTDPQRILVVNETDLSEKPEDALANGYTSWHGPGADKLAYDWFRDNFGITFHEEERDVKVLELKPETP